MYDQLVGKGAISADPRQRLMAEACEPLLRAIREEASRRTASGSSAVFGLLTGGPACSEVGGSGVDPRKGVLSRLWGRVFSRSRSETVQPFTVDTVGVAEKRGLYLHGDVGIGKTMILDLFELSDVGLPKRRAHLHSFMTELSDRLVRCGEQLSEHRRAVRGDQNATAAIAGVRPIDLVVADVLEESPVLCFDEFQTFDVAHAALLAAFFSAAFERGLFLMTTSNRPPEDLCTISASFNRFLPSLQHYCAVVEVGAIRDYRQRPRSEYYHDNVFLYPNNRAAAERLLRRVEAGIEARMPPAALTGRVAGTEVVAKEPPTWITQDTLWHHGRCLVIPYHCGGVAVFDFRDICGGHSQDLASSDYQLLALHFHTVVIYNVPQIGTANRNTAHQFIVLVDELYQHNVKLLFTAQVPWRNLLDTTNTANGPLAIEAQEETVASDYYSEGEDDRSGHMASYSFRNDEEVISFARIRSRLTEMGCSSYLIKQHTSFLVSDFDFNALIADDV